MRLAIFEDRQVPEFGPLVLTRPVFELLCGHFSLRQRLLTGWDFSEWGVFIRPYLAAVYQEQQPQAQVNNWSWLTKGPTLLVSGRWLPDASTLDAFNPETIGYCGGQPVIAMLSPDEASALGELEWEPLLDTLARQRRPCEVGGRVVKYPWQLVDHNPEQIVADFRLRQWGGKLFEAPQVIRLGPEANLHVHPTARIDPFVVLDARSGPISIEAHAVVQSFTRLEGPCHIGSQTQLFRAQIKGGTSLGPVCRAGGEIEATILQGYSNKYHDGFLGHSFIGEWINLGAQTLSSDLKVDYSQVTVPLQGQSLDTGLKKVGCFIGDFTKTGINALFNTGTSVGMMCLVLPTGGYAPRYLPSFCSLRDGDLTSGLPFERWLEAVRATLGRRDVALTPAYERMIRYLYQATRLEREDAIQRCQARREQKPV